MSDIKAQIEFLKKIEKVTEEFEAAYEVRKEDPERWDKAKHAFQEQRSFWRGVAQANLPQDENAVVVDSVSGGAQVHAEENN